MQHTVSSKPVIMMAPMEGVVDAVTRQLYSQIGGFDRFVTEFVRLTDKLLPDHVFYKYSPELHRDGRTLEGVPVFVQLLGGRASVFAENAARACELGAPGIDLNFGCPAPTVNRHDGGATLLKNPERVFEVVSAVRRAVPVAIPVTAKIRLGFDHKDNCVDIALAAESGGAAELIVHARTRNEGYRPPAHWEYIAKIRSALTKTKVIANGDIWSVQDYWACREKSACESVALGRGAMACPDLALQIRKSLAQSVAVQMNQKLVSPSYNMQGWVWGHIYKTWVNQFVRESEIYRDNGYAVARTKQWLRLLSRQYPEALTAFEQVKQLRHTREIYAAIENHS
jgi:tRNA-dihydrouridine synthase C